MTELTLTELALFELLSLECRADSDGTLRYYDAQGLPHREHGPAVERVDGYRAWYQNGQLHRSDGPAVVRPDGIQEWYIKGKELADAEMR